MRIITFTLLMILMSGVALANEQNCEEVLANYNRASDGTHLPLSTPEWAWREFSHCRMANALETIAKKMKP